MWCRYRLSNSFGLDKGVDMDDGWYVCLDCSHLTEAKIYCDNGHCTYCSSMELRDLDYYEDDFEQEFGGIPSDEELERYLEDRGVEL